MSKIHHYRVEVTDPANPGILGKERSFKAEMLSVVAENAKYLVLDNDHFTRVRKEKYDYDTCLNKPEISLHANDSVWGNRVTYTLYATKDKRRSTIRREIEAAIERKYGFFVRGFNLSFIDEVEVA